MGRTSRAYEQVLFRRQVASAALTGDQSIRMHTVVSNSGYRNVRASRLETSATILASLRCSL